MLSSLAFNGMNTQECKFKALFLDKYKDALKEDLPIRNTNITINITLTTLHHLE